MFRVNGRVVGSGEIVRAEGASVRMGKAGALVAFRSEVPGVQGLADSTKGPSWPTV